MGILKKFKSKPAEELDTDYDTIYYRNDSSSAPAETTDTSSDLYNEYEDDDAGVRIVMTEEPAKEVAKAEPLLKRVFTPKSCQESKEIVDAFKEGRVVVICLEELNRENFIRLFDYAKGAVDALDGILKKVDRDTAALLPNGVDESISIDDVEEEIVSGETDGAN